MPLRRDDSGIWFLTPDDRHDKSHPVYLDSLTRYLTALDPAFSQAREVSEFNFLLSIFAVRGMQDAGWDPYETTLSAINAVREVHNSIEGEASVHLALWLYGHIMEASEPYEFLGNLINIAAGGQFNIERFPPRNSGMPLSPQTKIERLESHAAAADLAQAILPMKEAWDRDFRNAIFHADYSLHGTELRTIRPIRRYKQEEFGALVNRAMAYHEAMSILRRMHVESYVEPVPIPCDPRFSNDPNEMAMVIVREGYGAVGLKDAWTEDELRRGRIPFRLGRFTIDESRMLDANRTLALLPTRTNNTEPA